MTETECIFCKIVAGEIPSAKIYEDEDVVAFLDINPTTKGHTLVVPKKHVATFLEADDEVIERLIKVSRDVGKAIVKAMNADGLNIGINNGKAAGQIIFHLHFHLIPRYANDGLKCWPQGKYEEGEIEKVKDEILKIMQKER